MLIGWEEFKKKNKEKAKEIEILCLKISAKWPKATLSKKEKEKRFEKIFASEDFQTFKEMMEEEIVIKETFSSSGDLKMLALSQIIAGRKITR